MAEPQTLCPKCGFSPIPDRAETCPKCGENFSFHPLWKVAQRKMMSKTDSIEMESTTFGGLTGEVSANPIPASAVLALCALVWLLRASGLAANHVDPQWLFAVGAMQLGTAFMLLATVGPATALAQVMAVVQLAVPFLVMSDASGGLPVAVASGLPGIALLVTTVGEPGPVRRNAGIVAGVVAFIAAVGAVFSLQTGEAAARGGTIANAEENWELRGSGLERLARADLAPHLTVPPETHRDRHAPFGNRQKGVFGLVSQTTGGTPNLSAGCEEWLKAFGGVNEVQRLGTAPAMFGPESLVLYIKTGSGASGRLACGLKSGTLWALTVVSSDPTPSVGAAEFERAATAFSIK